MKNTKAFFIYDNLLGLPLFQGMNRSDIEEVVAHVKFGFERYSTNKVVVREGMSCHVLYFLLKGRLTVCTSSADHSYSFEEELSAPDMLQPECLFGLTQRYTRTFVTQGRCDFFTIDKQAVMRLTDEYTIFRLNLMNAVTTRAQRLSARLWHPAPTDTRQRIVRFIETHCFRPVGAKTIRMTVECLALQINANCQEVSAALKQFASDGLIEKKRGMIIVPALQNLSQACK